MLDGIPMIVRWHGHACFEIADSTTVVTDPHDGKSLGIPAPSVSADLVLVTHEHFDHNAVRVVRGAPEVVRTFVGKTAKKGVRIEGIKEYHDHVQGSKRGEISIYRFTVDGINFVHMGDIGHVPGDEVIEKLKGADILFIPVGDIFTVGPDEAWEITERIKPRVVVPMHYRIGGLSLSIKPVNGFLEKLPEERVMKLGNSIDFEKEDLPEETEMWVFSL